MQTTNPFQPIMDGLEELKELIYSIKKEPEIELKKKFYSFKEASEILKCHPNTLRLWDKKGILKAIRFGERGDRRYKREDILKLLEKND